MLVLLVVSWAATAAARRARAVRNCIVAELVFVVRVFPSVYLSENELTGNDL